MTGDTTGPEEEGEAPAEEALNEMIARSEEELAFYQQMDRDRRVADKAWMNDRRKVAAAMNIGLVLMSYRPA